MPEQNVYRELSEEMRDGLKNIYQQISSASQAGNETEALFSEASGQLREVVKATESAAMDIMEIVEKQLEAAGKNGRTLADLLARYQDDPALRELASANSELESDLTSVLTSLSFQDITGQRIKKVMTALESLEANVLNLYLSSGLIMEGAEREPEKNSADLRAEAQVALKQYQESKGSELKGPDANGVSQAAIDDMLAQLGL